VVAFRDHYGLISLSFKQLDKFMYLSGGRILESRRNKNTQASAM
jgi:hypothetical protein